MSAKTRFGKEAKGNSKMAYCIYSNKRRTPDALTPDIFAIVIMKLSVFFSPREFLS